MAELKTKPNDSRVEDFINSIDNPTRRQDGFTLLEMFTRITGEQPKMWGASIIGFGMYHYKSQKSSQEGDWPLVGFSPRKQNLSLYVMLDSDQPKNVLDQHQELLNDLGKHKTSVACLYINKLDDIDKVVLEQIIDKSFQANKAKLT